MFAIALILVSGLNLERVEWESLLNANFIYDIAPTVDGAWCATNGGVRFFSLADSSFTVSYTNVDGLPHNTCRSLALTGSGELWVGTDRGLALIDAASGKVLAYPYIEDSVHSLALLNDTLAVARSTDVYLIDTRGTTGYFDDDLLAIPQPLADRGARVICWFRGDLWMGAEDGLRRYDPSTDQVSVAGGLSSKIIRDLDPADSLNVLTSKGVARFTESGSSFRQVFSFDDELPSVTSGASVADTIYVSATDVVNEEYGYQRLIRYVESQDSIDYRGFWIDTPAGEKRGWAWNLQVVRPDDQGRIWVGLGSGSRYSGDGLVVWDGEWKTVWDGSQSFDCKGLNSNLVGNLLLDGNGNLWVVHYLGEFSGVTRYTAEKEWWNIISFAVTSSGDTVPFDYSSRVSDVDSKGRALFGTWWTNTAVVRYDPSTEIWDSYDWGEGAARNIVSWLAVDPLDRIWVAHFGSNEMMSVLSPELDRVVAEIPWPYGEVYSLAFDARNEAVWAATTAGLLAIHTEDFTNSPGTGEFRYEIADKIVWDVVTDGADGVWGVTPEGAFHWTPEEVIWYTAGNSPIPSNDLVSVERDPWGRIYFLTRYDGIAAYDPAEAAYDTSASLWQVISKENSSLIPGFEYTWIDADRTGRLAVGTKGGGVSVATLPAPSDSLRQSVSVYPNPCYAQLGLPVRFTPLDDAEAVTVYTLAGERVRHIPQTEFVRVQGALQAELDVSNLAAGLYIAAVRFADRTERVKFVVMR
ncbi:T9SS type A sorting domain-containing protein [candidate division WOR-3 bacterium]|nr:T9SS type A sorting domain-containing protein [candidate division WOR-3 bacterium]